MKKLIKVLLLFAFLFSFSQAQSQVVGKIVENKAVLTILPAELLFAFNINVNELGVFDLTMTFTDVEIIQHESKYYLVFTDENQTTRATFAINLIHGDMIAELNVEPKLCCISFNCPDVKLGCFPNEEACSECQDKEMCMRISSQGSLIVR